MDKLGTELKEIKKRSLDLTRRPLVICTWLLSVE